MCEIFLLIFIAGTKSSEKAERTLAAFLQSNCSQGRISNGRPRKKVSLFGKFFRNFSHYFYCRKKIETELNKLTEVLKQTEEQREQLDRLVKELKDTTTSQKRRIDELLHLNEEKEVLLKSQRAALESKVSRKIRLHILRNSL